MPHNLSFDTIVHYEDSEEGIAIPVSVSFGDLVANTFAKVDCGAQVWSRRMAPVVSLWAGGLLQPALSDETGRLRTLLHLC
jgi:hypothetical protein